MPDMILRGEQVTKCYGKGDGAVLAMDHVCFTIEEREVIVILGPSGCGKSTFLNMIGGMDTPSSGDIWYRERNLREMTSNQLADYRRDAVGFVFQFFHLLPSLTALENITLASNLVKDPMVPKEVMAIVGLEGRENHFPSQLSGGEQQRVSIARAIVKKPRMLLCDEPTGALDSKNGLAVTKLLLSLRRQLGCTVVIVTHNTSLADLADRVFYMKDGRLETVRSNSAPLSPEDIEW